MERTVRDINGGQNLASHSDESEVKELTSVITCRLPVFHRIAMRRLGNMADAEDAVQDALLSAYKHLGQFKREAQMSTWLTSIVINSARTKGRRRPQQLHLSLERQDREEGNYGSFETLPDCRPGPEELCRRWELADRLTQLSTRLSPTLRRAFQLHEVDGLSIRETATILGVNTGTVKARTSRARAHLRRLVQKSLGD